MKIRKITNPKTYKKKKIKNLESDMNSTRRSKARDATSLHMAMKSTPLISPIPQSNSHLRFYSPKEKKNQFITVISTSEVKKMKQK